jgi:pimeloyl-ACP methyl ester carboxylesterase
MRRIFAMCLVVLGASLACLRAPAEVGAAPIVKRGYVDMRYGQLHYVMATPAIARRAWKTTLVLLHQSPNTSTEYSNFVTEMGRDRMVLAIDTPGYGGSDGPTSIPRIEDYAGAIAEGLHNLGFGPKRPVDIFGYHTGNFIATEIALQNPAMVRRLVYSGVYVVSPEQLASVAAHVVHPATDVDALQQFCTNLPATQKRYQMENFPDDLWTKVRVDSLRSRTRVEYGHAAAFAYAAHVREKLPLLTQPVLLVVIDDGIMQPTKDSAPFFKHATLIDMHELKNDVFVNHASELGTAVRKFLD